MSWSTNAYCTLDDVKELLGRSSTSDDTLITDLIPQAQAEIDAELGFMFQEDTGGVRIYKGNDTDQLLIEQCLSLTSVFESGTRDITSECTLIPENRVPHLLVERASESTFSSSYRYTFTGNWGRTSVPADIKRACILLTIHFLKLKETSYNAMVTTQSANAMFGMMRNPRAWPEDICVLIDRHKPVLYFSTGR